MHISVLRLVKVALFFVSRGCANTASCVVTRCGCSSLTQRCLLLFPTQFFLTRVLVHGRVWQDSHLATNAWLLTHKERTGDMRGDKLWRKGKEMHQEERGRNKENNRNNDFKDRLENVQQTEILRSLSSVGVCARRSQLLEIQVTDVDLMNGMLPKGHLFGSSCGSF